MWRGKRPEGMGVVRVEGKGSTKLGWHPALSCPTSPRRGRVVARVKRHRPADTGMSWGCITVSGGMALPCCNPYGLPTDAVPMAFLLMTCLWPSTVMSPMPFPRYAGTVFGVQGHVGASGHCSCGGSIPLPGFCHTGHPYAQPSFVCPHAIPMPFSYLSYAISIPCHPSCQPPYYSISSLCGYYSISSLCGLLFHIIPMHYSISSLCGFHAMPPAFPMHPYTVLTSQWCALLAVGRCGHRCCRHPINSGAQVCDSLQTHVLYHPGAMPTSFSSHSSQHLLCHSDCIGLVCRIDSCGLGWMPMGSAMLQCAAIGCTHAIPNPNPNAAMRCNRVHPCYGAVSIVLLP